MSSTGVTYNLDMTESRLRLIAWSSLVIGFLLLVWPVSPDVALWDLPGAFGGGTEEAARLLRSASDPYGGRVMTPLTSLMTGDALLTGQDRLQMTLGLVLIGISIGTGLAVRTRTPRPAEPKPKVFPGYQA